VQGLSLSGRELCPIRTKMFQYLFDSLRVFNAHFDRHLDIA
jgi:hypothetical protein